MKKIVGIVLQLQKIGIATKQDVATLQSQEIVVCVGVSSLFVRGANDR